jgi:hypothetical protein
MSINPSDVIIEPSIYTTSRTIVSFSVSVSSLELFTSVTLSVVTFDAARSVVNSQTMKLSGDDYLAWNNNDQYIINYVANKLGFTLAPTTA